MSEPAPPESFARRHRFAVGVATGVLIALVALVVLAIAGGTSNRSRARSPSTVSDVRHYAAAAEALCVPMLPEIQRRDRDEHLAYADELAGKITAVQMFARWRADLTAIITATRRTAREITVIPAPGADPPLIRLAQGMLRVADTMSAEERAIARFDQQAVKAEAAKGDRRIDANAKLARAAGTPACVV